MSGRTRPDPSAEAALDLLADLIAERVAKKVAARLGASAASLEGDRWLTTTQAAAYLGVHRDTLRKLAAERAIPAEQDRPGCKLYFRAHDLDRWREAGGRPAHRASTA